MREIVKKLLSPSARASLKRWLPYALKQPNPSLRQFGTVQEIYPWRVDEELDTRAYIQNYFSVFYPELDTATDVGLWCYDAGGALIGQRTGKLARNQTLAVSLREWVGPGRGTLMWHVVMPPSVAERPECAQHHAYFTDRGYIAFHKEEAQASYMHGIDRYAVFQKTADKRFDAFYAAADSFEWRPEIPLSPELGCTSMDVMTVNRCKAPAEIQLELLDAAKKPVATFKQRVSERGLFFQTLDSELLKRLGAGGSMRATGLPTPWTRVMILRHFSSGAIAAMHC